MDHACSVHPDLGSHVFGAIVLVRCADQYLVAVSICIGEYGVTSKLNMTIEVSVAQLSDAGLLAELGRETSVEAFEMHLLRGPLNKMDLQV